MSVSLTTSSSRDQSAFLPLTPGPHVVRIVNPSVGDRAMVLTLDRGSPIRLPLPALAPPAGSMDRELIVNLGLYDNLAGPVRIQGPQVAYGRLLVERCDK